MTRVGHTIDRLVDSVVTFAHGGDGAGGSTSVVHELSPLKVLVIVMIAVAGLILCLRGMGTWGGPDVSDSPEIAGTDTVGRGPSRWSPWFLVGAVLLVAPVLSFDRFAYQDRTVTVPESPVPVEIIDDGPAELSSASATDGGDVHIDANNPTKLALNLDCEIRALDEVGGSATADDPSLRAPVLLLPGDSQVLELRLPVQRRVASMTALCEIAPFSRKQRARLDREGIPYW